MACHVQCRVTRTPGGAGVALWLEGTEGEKSVRALSPGSQSPPYVHGWPALNPHRWDVGARRPARTWGCWDHGRQEPTRVCCRESGVDGAASRIPVNIRDRFGSEGAPGSRVAGTEGADLGAGHCRNDRPLSPSCHPLSIPMPGDRSWAPPTGMTAPPRLEPGGGLAPQRWVHV